MAGAADAVGHAGRLLAAGHALGAEDTLLHRVLLVLGSIGVAQGEVGVVGRLLPVERADTRVGAGGQAHAAADALVVVLAHNARLLVLPRGAHRAHLGTGRVLAVLAGHGPVLHLGIVPGATSRVRRVAALGEHAVPDNVVGDVVGHFAHDRAGLAARAALKIDDHSVSHGFLLLLFLRLRHHAVPRLNFHEAIVVGVGGAGPVHNLLARQVVIAAA